MRDNINLIMDSRIKREKESTFGVIAEFDSRVNSDEIWYGSQGLHLISAPIYVFRNSVELGQSHLALDQIQIALNKLF
jgi:hypothetical protein